MTEPGGYLLAYFRSETEPDGEQLRFALSDGLDPLQWTPLHAGRPVLPCTVGEGGVRDPFLLRDERRGCFVLLATDLRIGSGGDWQRAVRHGSDAIVIWESPDLVRWSAPRRQRLSTPAAGNTWAPKAFWSAPRGEWLVFWASALYRPDDDRRAGSYQRMMVAATTDFRHFSAPEVYLDAGHDIIDATFVQHEHRWYRFSANAHSAAAERTVGRHIFAEVGAALDDPAFTPVAVDIGRQVMEQAEGPAIVADPRGERWYLLADEFGLRGYQLFESDNLDSGHWRHLPQARLPDGARHGSLLAISAAERRRLRAARW